MSRESTIAGLTRAITQASAPREGMEALMFSLAEADANRRGGAALRVFEAHKAAESALNDHGAAVAAIVLAAVEGRTATDAQVQALIDADERLDVIEVEHKAAHEALQNEAQPGPGNDAFDSLETSEADAIDPLKLH